MVLGSNKANYEAAFPGAHHKMGCDEQQQNITYRNCVGYELAANLDFDTNGNGRIDAGDDYWNGGQGWLPIGGATGDYEGDFDGNAYDETGLSDPDGGPFTISNLYINRTGANYAGLFAHLSGVSGVYDLGLVNVDITLGGSVNEDAFVGALAGASNANMQGNYTTGSVTANVTFSAANRSLVVGGLVGRAQGPVIANHSWAVVNAGASGTNTEVLAGGLAGDVQGGGYTIASYAAGAVTAEVSGEESDVKAGGLVGENPQGGSYVTASYARGDVSAEVLSGTGTTTANAGGLVGDNFEGGYIEYSFSTGAVSAAGVSGTVKKAGGLIGGASIGGSVTASYWDTDTSGVSTSTGGTGKTTSALQTPTDYGASGIYANWNADFNVPRDGGGEDPWDFGANNQYPALKYRKHVAATQRATLTATTTATTIYEAVGGPTSATLTATMSTPWNVPVVFALNAPNCLAPSTSSTNMALTFTSSTWNSTTTVGVKLAANPNATTTIYLAQDNVRFSPGVLVFTSTNWNTAQNVGVRLVAAPANDVTVYLDAFCSRFKLSAPDIIIPAGATTTSVTLSAINNKDDESNVSMTLGPTGGGANTYLTADKWIVQTSSNLAITLMDDDELGKTTNVAASEISGVIEVTWDAVTGATGYVIQWKAAGEDYDSARQVAVTATTTGEIPETSLISDTDYTISVYATKAGVDSGETSDEVAVSYVGGVGRNFSIPVPPKSIKNKTVVLNEHTVFPGTTRETLYEWVVETLPDAAQGQLMVEQRGRWYGRPQCKNEPGFSLCKLTITPVTAEEGFGHPYRSNLANRKDVYFYPSDTFAGTTFTYRTIVRDDYTDPTTERPISAASVITLALAPDYTPTTPANLTAEWTGIGEITLKWTVPPEGTDNQGANKNASLEVRQKEGNGPWSAWERGPNYTLKTFWEGGWKRTGGFKQGVTYTFQVRANNYIRASAGSNEAVVRASPNAPEGFDATGGKDAVTLSWTASTDNSIAKYQYRQVERAGPLHGTPGDRRIELVWDRPDTGGRPIGRWQYRVGTSQGDVNGSAWVDIPGSGDSTTWFMVTSRKSGSAMLPLVNGTTYYVQVRSNSVPLGNESLYHVLPNTVVATPTLGAVATWADFPTVAASSAAKTFSTSTWSIATTTTVALVSAPSATTTFGLYLAGAEFTPAQLEFGPDDYSVDKSVSVRLTSQPSATTTVNLAVVHPLASPRAVTGLKNGIAYSFQLRSMSAAGPSPATGRQTAPVRPAAASLTATPGDGQATLRWSDPNDWTITKYQHSKDGGATWTDTPTSGTFRWVAAYDSSVTSWQYMESQPRPHNAGGLTAIGNTGPVQLFWTPPDNEVASWQYRVRQSSLSGWTNEAWQAVPNSASSTRSHTASAVEQSPVIVVVQEASIEFTTTNYNVATTTRFSLAARPTATTTILLVQDNVEFTPSMLTFGTSTYNILRNVSVKLKTQPATTTTLNVTTARQIGVSFAWQVRALNASGVALSANIGGSATSTGEACALSFTLACGHIALSWTFTNTKLIDKWQYQHKSGGGNYGSWTDVPNSDKATATYTVPGLTVNTAYTFQVRAVNTSGTVVAGPFGEPTATPTTLPAWTHIHHSNALTRSHTVDGLAPALLYIYRVRPVVGSVPSNAAEIAAGTAVKSQPTAHTITGLTNNTLYTLQVRAVNAAGAGPAGAASTTPVTSLASPVLAAEGQGSSVKLDWTMGNAGDTTGWAYRHTEPVGGLAAFADDESAELVWNAPSDTTGIARWQYRYKTTGGYGDWTDVSGSGANTTSARVTGLTNGTGYTFQVQGVNSSDALVAGTARGDATATSSATAWTSVSGASTRTHTVSGLASSTLYAFQVRAVNAIGGGRASNAATTYAEARPAKPSGLAAASGEHKKVTLTWPTTNTADKWQYGVDVPIASTPATLTFASTTWDTAQTVQIELAGAPPVGAGAMTVTLAQDNVNFTPSSLTFDANTWHTAQQVSVKLRTKPKATTTVALPQFTGTTWTAMTPTGAGANHAFEVAGLTNGTAYTFLVRGLNRFDEPGPVSDSVTATPKLATPTGLAAVSGDTIITYTWNNPNDSSITHYEYRHTGVHENVWVTVPASGPNTTSFTLENRINGWPITFYLRAVSAGSVSEVVQVTAASQARPGRPTGLTATAGDGQVTLDWTNPNDSSITTWQYRVGDGAWVDVKIAASSTPATLTFGTGTWDTAQTARIELAAAPAATTTLTLAQDNVEFTPSTLTFGVNNWNTAQQVSVKLKAAPQAATTVALSQIIWANATTVTAKDLANRQGYRFDVRAVNSIGIGPYASVSATPRGAPPTPTGLKAVAGNKTVTLTWDVYSSWLDRFYLEGYEYQQRTRTGQTWDDWGTTWTSTGSEFPRVQVTGLTNEKEYQFRVRGFNSMGGGTPTAPVAATPRAPAPDRPTAVKATPTGTTTVTLEWKNPAGYATHSGYRYKPASGSESGYSDWYSIDLATSTEVTGLTAGVLYTFQVRTQSKWGGGAASGEVSAWTYPAAPANLVATPGDRLVSLTWDDPANSGITRYEYQQKTTGDWGANWTPIPGSGATTTQHVVTNLTRGTPYTFRVRAFSIGAGVVSAEVTSLAQPAPATPTGVSASATGTATTTVTWSYPNAGLIDKFQVRYRAGNASWSAWADVATGTMTYSVTSGLTLGTTYTFEVRAVNNRNVPSPAAQARAATPPVAPTGFSAMPGDGQATLYWDDPAYPSITGWQYRQTEPKGGLAAFGGGEEVELSWMATSNAAVVKWQYRHKSGGNAFPGTWTDVPNSTTTSTGYIVPNLANDTGYTFQVRALNSSDAQVGAILGDPTATTTATGGWTDISGSGANTTSHTAASLGNGTEYAFQVRAVNAAGDGVASDVASATPSATTPARPSGLTATPGDRKVTLEWTNPAGEVTGNAYRYKPASSAESGYTGWNAIGKATSTEITGLTAGVRYTFQVRAGNSVDDGAPSNPVSAWTYPAAPANLVATPGDKLVSLAWDDPANSSITRYEFQYKTAGAWSATWLRATSTGAATTQYLVSDLTNATAYTFRLRAFSVSAGAVSAEVTATPQAIPSMPTGVSASAEGVGTTTVTWSYADAGLIEKFQVRRRAGNAAWGAWIDLATTTTSYATTSALAYGTTYTFEVRAVNNLDVASPAAQARAATPPAAPTGFSAMPDDGQATLHWDNPAYPSITAWQYRQTEPKGGLAAFGDDKRAELSWSSPADTSAIAKWQYQYKSVGGSYGGWTDVTGSDDTTTSATVTGLTNGTGYTFRVRALNSSDAQVGAILGDPTATSTAAGGWTAISGSGANTTSHTATSLVNETEYAFQVRAVSPAGDGEASAVVVVTPTATAPGRPTGLTATPTGATTVTLEWTNPAGYAAHSGYRYKPASSTESGYTNWNSIALATSTEVTGLTAGVRYTFQVRAENKWGAGAPSAEVSAWTYPAAPTNLVATFGDGLVSLTWDDPSNSSITRYEYQQKVTGANWGATWTRITNSATTTQHVVGNLVNNTSYTFRLRAFSAGAGAVSAEVSATPLPVPSMPTGVSASAQGVGTTTVTWIYADTALIDKFQVRRRADNAAWSAWIDLATTTTSYATTTGLAYGTTYTFEVRAVNAQGQSGPAAQARAATPPVAPTGFSATPDFKQVTLRWDDPAYPSITGWQYRQGQSEGGLSAFGGDGEVELSWSEPASTTAIDRWQYRHKSVGADYGVWLNIPGSGTSTTAYTVPNLVNDTAYTFEARAVNASNTPVAGTALGDPTATPTATGGWTAMPGSGANTTAHTVTSLANHVTYLYRLRAVNAAGDGLPSAMATATTLGPPLAPTGLTASAGDKQVLLEWANPLDIAITRYEFRYATMTGNYPAIWTAVPQSHRDTAHHRVTGLDNDTAYKFQVRAVSARGGGAAAEVTATPAAVPAPPKPAAPTGFVARGWDERARLGWSWTDTGNAGDFVEWQLLIRAEDATSTAGIVIPSGSATTSVRLHWRNLGTDGTTGWEYRQTRISSTSTTRGDWTPIPCVSPCDPATLDSYAFTVVLCTSTRYIYDVRANVGGSNVDAHVVEAWVGIDAASTTRAYIQSGLDNYMAYRFSLRVALSGGESDRVVAAARTTEPPSKPTGLTATPGVGKARLNWNAIKGPPADLRGPRVDKYQYRYKVEGGDYGDWWTDIAQPGSICTLPTACTTPDVLVYTVRGLQNGVEHTFQVRGVNTDGPGDDWGANSDEATTTPLSAPLQPGNLRATASDKRIDLAWNRPSAGAGVTRWEIRYAHERTVDGKSVDWQGWTEFTPATTTDTMSHALPGLINEKPYQVEVRAWNALHAGIPASVVATPHAPMAAPTSLAASAGDERVTLTWTASDSRITEWEYQYKKSTDSTYGAWVSLGALSGAFRSHVVTGLTNGETYDFRVRARGYYAVSPASAKASARPLPASVPGKPTDLTASARSTRVSLSWNAAPDDAITGWALRISPDSAADLVIGTGAPQTIYLSWTDPNDTAIESYQYSADGTNWTPMADSDANTTSAEVSWPFTPGQVVTYQVRGVKAGPTYATSTGLQVWTKIDKSAAFRSRPVSTSTTSYSFAQHGLANGAEYTFRVRSANLRGHGPASDPASATPIAAPNKPTGLTATASTSGSATVTLTWTSPTGTSTAPVQGYQYRARTTFWHRWQDVPGSDATTTGYAVTQASGNNLQHGRLYAFQVRAVNSEGTGAASDAASARPLAGVPGAASLTSATGGDAQARIAWYVSFGNTRWIDSWEYSADDGATWQKLPANSSGYRACRTTGVNQEECGDYSTPALGGNRFTRYATITGLTNGKTYTFKVRAVNAAGNGVPSNALTADTRALAPASFSVTSGDAEATLNWTKNDNDDTVTGWQYRRKAGVGQYGHWKPVFGAAANSTTTTVTGLANATAYTFQVRAVNRSGGGAPSAERTANPQLARPLKPTGFQASPGHAKALLQWIDPHNDSITRWQYSQATGSGQNLTWGNWTDICVTSGDSGCPSKMSHMVENLTNGTTYSFKLRAVNPAGNSPESDVATTSPKSVPGQPTDLTATAGNRQVSLSWKAPAGETVTAWDLRIYSPLAWQKWRTVTPGSGANNTLTLTVTQDNNGHTLSNNADYYFQVRAWNASGAGTPSALAGATPVAGAPGAASYLWAGGGDGRVELSWNRAGGPFATHWEYRYKTATQEYNTWARVPGSTRGTTSHTLTTLGNGKRYTFQVRPVNDVGAGGSGPEAVAETLPLVPTQFLAMAGDEEVVLHWNKNDSDETDITRWQYTMSVDGGDYGDWNDVSGGNASSTSYAVTGLDNGTTYLFKVRLVNAVGIGPESSAASSSPAIGLPDQPTGLSAVIGDKVVGLSWDDPGNDRITEWQYIRGTGSGDNITWGNWTKICETSTDSDCPTQTAVTVDGLTNDTRYTFRIRAVTVAGNGPASNPVYATPRPVPAPPSDPPSGPRAQPGNSGEIVLNWTANASSTGWQYRYKTTGDYGDWIDIPCESPCDPATLTTHTVTGLDNNVQYTFQVRSQNDIGWGTPGDFVSRPVASVPGATTLSAAKGGDRLVTLTWSYAGAVYVEKWQYSTSTTVASSTWVWHDFNASDSNTRTAAAANLANGKSYTFRVRAANDKGYGQPSAALVEPTLPLAPASFSAAGGYQKVTLTWTRATADETVTGWEYNFTSAGATRSWTAVPNSASSTTSYEVTGLDNGDAYTFRLRAVNAAGKGAASPPSVANTAPTAPTGLAAAAGDRKVTLSWTNPAGSLTDNSYRYKPASAGNSGYTGWTSIGSATTTREVAGLTNGVFYTFQVRAHNAAGGGTPSSEASEWTYPAAPANLVATPGDELVSLSWDDPANSSITRYEYQQKTGGNWPVTWTRIPGSSATTTQYVVSALTNATSSTFRLRAVGTGAGAVSAEVTATPQPAPSIPTGVSASAIGAATTTVNWSYANVALIEKFQVRYRADNATWGAWTDVAKTLRSYKVTSGLEYGTVYTFEVRAVNNQDLASPGVQAKAATAPAKPAGLTAAPGFRQVTLTWDELGYTSVTGWQYRQKKGADPYGQWTPIPGSDADTTSHTVTQLFSGAAYTFQVRAVNAAGDGLPSDEVTATPPLKPTEPSTITLTEMFKPGWSQGSFELTIGWTKPADTTIDRYQYREAQPVGGLTAFGGTSTAELSWSRPADTAGIAKWQYRHKSGGDYASWQDIPNSSQATTAHVVPNLTADTAYTFQVRAVNSSDAQVGATLGDAQATPSSSAGWKDIPGSDVNTTSYKLPPEFQSVPFWAVQVRAINESGFGTPSNTASANMLPGRTAKLRANKTLGSNTYTITLDWDKLQRHNADDDSIGHWQFRTAYGTSTDAALEGELEKASWKTIPSSGVNTGSYDIRYADRARYLFQVRAVTPSGNGAPSHTVSLVLASTRRQNFTATYTGPSTTTLGGPSGGGTAKLTWASTTDPSIQRYQYRESDTSRWRNISCPEQRLRRMERSRKGREPQARQDLRLPASGRELRRRRPGGHRVDHRRAARHATGVRRAHGRNKGRRVPALATASQDSRHNRLAVPPEAVAAHLGGNLRMGSHRYDHGRQDTHRPGPQRRNLRRSVHHDPHGRADTHRRAEPGFPHGDHNRRVAALR